MEEEISLHDQISAEKDRRKIKKLIDDGVISPEELANAPIYELTQVCKCRNAEPNENGRCTKCLTKYEEKRVG